jgi:hypothetical protein
LVIIGFFLDKQFPFFIWLIHQASTMIAAPGQSMTGGKKVVLSSLDKNKAVRGGDSRKDVKRKNFCARLA